MYAKRKKDRRSLGGKTSFPLKTKMGCLVEKDRRSIPDRRFGNIHLETVYVGDNKLPDYLTDASFPALAEEVK
jgi:hypothetical protein